MNIQGAFVETQISACRVLLGLNADRMRHFVRRIDELHLTAEDVVITCINVDDANGALLADALMPGHDWQAYRDRDELPIARGLARRDGIAEALADIHPPSAEKLKKMTGVAIVVVDDGVAEVFTPDEIPVGAS